MIRVLQIVNKMNRGGIETFLMNVYRNIDRDKLQFDFLTLETDTPGDYDEEIISLGGRIYQVPSRKKGLLKMKKQLNIFFGKHPEYKIVHAHVSSLTNVSKLKVAKKQGVKCRIVHSHNTKEGGSSIHKYFHRFNQLSLKSYATEYLACSDLAAKWMYPKELYNKKEFTIVNNGIETKKFVFNETIRNQKRKELSIESKFVVGHVGRFNQQKNHIFLIDIFKEIHDKNSDSVLMLVGDGELRKQIESKVDALGLSENVIFTGVRSDVHELFQAMDVFVLPSLYEGLPVVLVEAQAAGLKCFTTKDTVTSEVDIANLVEFTKLEEQANKWAHKILSSTYGARNNAEDIIKDSGYDIQKVAEDLQQWYETKV